MTKAIITSIIFDWKRTLYDPDNRVLLDGTEELLSALGKHNVPLILVGKGGNDMYNEVKRLNIGRYFKTIEFREGPKEDILFAPFVPESDPGSVLFIGDRTRSELAVGKKLGTTTIWVRQGKFADEAPSHPGENPDYTVKSLFEVKELLAYTFGLG